MWVWGMFVMWNMVGVVQVVEAGFLAWCVGDERLYDFSNSLSKPLTPLVSGVIMRLLVERQTIFSLNSLNVRLGKINA
ncbi:MAG: hypothetical protein KatS3mg023_2444 [Armatimonadota bacterium]|nr:MAG: hypothetical protein KatS3mg023_2444 [Armatimonadota bacterium]